MRNQLYFSLSAMLLCLTGSAYAQEMMDSTDLAMLGEGELLEDEFAFLEDAGMVELSSRHRQEIGMSPSAVTVITREDIEASGATTIPDLLRLVPGMDVTIVSPAYTSLSSRLHLSNTNNLYQGLIDGRDAINELVGGVVWEAEPISLDDVERIEILRGPASSLYGASAFAGVISITTRVVPEMPSAALRMSYGEHGSLELGARGSTRMGNWGFALSGVTEQADSFVVRGETARKTWRVRTVAEYRWSNSEKFRIDAAFSEASGGMNTSLGLIDIDFGMRALQLSYESKTLRGRLYWTQIPTHIEINAPLEFGGIRLANFVPIDSDGHTVDGEVQWTLPETLDKLLIMVGGGARVTFFGSDQLLDGDAYADITSSGYHQTGISRWEGRAGAFIHSEFAPADFVTVTGSLRFDYNTETNEFLSPRLAAVFKPAENHYLRAGVGRAFRKPALVETSIHPLVEFPPDSPITGPDRQNFLEFMSRQVSNSSLTNEELTSYEAGYLGFYLDGTLSLGVDLFYNQLRNLIGMKSEVVADAQGLPDLSNSIIRTEHGKSDTDVFGWEVVLRYTPSKHLSLLASWAHRELFDVTFDRSQDTTPKNLLTLGGRFRTESGLVGSLYLFSRSRITANSVENPAGILEPSLTMEMPNQMLALGKLGWKWQIAKAEIEAGAKLFLPISFSEPYFQYYGGDRLPAGHLLAPMIISASRRTDIPAFYSEWFMNCLRQEFVEVKNPYNPDQVSRVSLAPGDVDSIVFWTKNPAPLLAHLAEIEEAGHRYSFQFTLNNYPRDLEPGVPELEERMDRFIELSERIGPDNIVWRYDPIILSDKTGADFHRRAFENLCVKLGSRTRRVTVSLIDYYKKTKRNLKPLSYEFDLDAADRPETEALLGDLAKTAREHKLEIFSCAQERDYTNLGIPPGRCVEGDGPYKKDPSQREHCQCTQSRDIGSYGTCKHACVYCYAR
jgi:outer membrane receptor for ferrienterochelin and colicin/DNA repair photolyase